MGWIENVAALCLAGIIATGCQFQPLYASAPQGVQGSMASALSQISVSEVDTRSAQLVRNHLVFLLNGGSTPFEATHDVRLRVSKINKTLASRVRTNNPNGSNQIGNTAGSVQINASYEIYDNTRNEIVARGSRSASAAYDQTSQSFASERAEIDAEARAATAAAEQLRLAIAGDLSRI